MRVLLCGIILGLLVPSTCAIAQVVEHPNASVLGQLVYSDLTVDLEQAPATTVMEKFESDLGILMNIFWKTEDRAGLDPETTITLKLTDQPALVVLERIIAQLDSEGNATWQLRHGSLEVGLKSQLASRGRQRLETYYIRDLLFTIRNFEAPALDTSTGTGGNGGGSGGTGGGVGGGSGGGGQGGGIGGGTPEPKQQDEIEQIIELIVKFVEPQLWEQNGGECSITNYKKTLLIRAPDFMHRQINGYSYLASQPEQVRQRRVLYSDSGTRVVVDRLPIR